MSKPPLNIQRKQIIADTCTRLLDASVTVWRNRRGLDNDHLFKAVPRKWAETEWGINHAIVSKRRDLPKSDYLVLGSNAKYWTLLDLMDSTLDYFSNYLARGVYNEECEENVFLINLDSDDPFIHPRLSDLADTYARLVTKQEEDENGKALIAYVFYPFHNARLIADHYHPGFIRDVKSIDYWNQQ